jgi:hypothetical protein
MSYDESDAAEDRQWEYFYQQIAPQAIEEFVSDRMTSYYLDHRDVAVAGAGLLSEAIQLQDTHPRAALVLAHAAAEVFLKNAILKPAFQGLVHDPNLADAVADVAVRQSGLERFAGFLAQYIGSFTAIDLKTYCRSGSTTTLLLELSATQAKRNAVIHGGDLVDANEARFAIVVAEAVAEDVFGAVLVNRNLHRHADWMLCPKFRCADAISTDGRA